MQKQFKMNHFLSGKWYVRIALLYFLIAAAIPALRASTGLLIQQTGQIVGRVTDAQGVPLSGASIRIAGQQRSVARSEEHTYELQSLMRISYAVFCLKKKQHTVKRYETEKTHAYNTVKHTPSIRRTVQ